MDALQVDGWTSVGRGGVKTYSPCSASVQLLLVASLACSSLSSSVGLCIHVGSHAMHFHIFCVKPIYLPS